MVDKKKKSELDTGTKVAIGAMMLSGGVIGGLAGYVGGHVVADNLPQVQNDLEKKFGDAVCIGTGTVAGTAAGMLPGVGIGIKVLESRGRRQEEEEAEQLEAKQSSSYSLKKIATGSGNSKPEWTERKLREKEQRAKAKQAAKRMI